MAEWNRCDDCGKYIGFAELESGEARIRMVTPDSEYTRETWETLCSRCLARHNKSLQPDAGNNPQLHPVFRGICGGVLKSRSM